MNLNLLFFTNAHPIDSSILIAMLYFVFAMAFEVDIRKLFNPKAIALSLQRLGELKTLVMDLVYPESKRGQHPFAVIGRDEIVKKIKNVPVVRRGSAAYPYNVGDRKIEYIEPQPVDVSTFLTAKELNDLKLLDDRGLEYWRDSKIEDLRLAIRQTSEALCAQSLSGNIAYAMKIEGGYDTYEVDFGAIQSYTPSELWDAAGKTVAEIILDLIAMQRLLRLEGYGTNITWLAGDQAFAALANKVTALSSEQSRFQASIDDKGITFLGFRFQLFSETYYDYLTSANVDVLPPKKIKAIALDAPFAFRYCAIDDIEAGLQPVPFWVPTPEIKKNPSGVEIIARSKPFPMAPPLAICEATVLP